MDEQAQRAKHGDREAMADLVHRHYPFIYRFCARRLGPDLASDAAQETFLTAQKRMKSFEGRSELRTWLTGIALNTVRALSRRKPEEAQPEWVWSRGGDSPEESVINRETLRSALSRLSSEHREVVLMHEVEEMSYAEIAQVLGIPEGTVKSRLHHAFGNLRTLLEGSR